MQEAVSFGLALAPGPVDPGSSRLSEGEIPNQPRSEAWMAPEGVHPGDLWDSRLTPQSIVSAFASDQQESGLASARVRTHSVCVCVCLQLSADDEYISLARLQTGSYLCTLGTD